MTSPVPYYSKTVSSVFSSAVLACVGAYVCVCVCICVRVYVGCVECVCDTCVFYVSFYKFLFYISVIY